MIGIEASANLIIAACAAFGSITSVATLGWWMAGRFRASDDRQSSQLDKHEEKDQERHEENLERFRLISIALARLGYTNGNVVKVPKVVKAKK